MTASSLPTRPLRRRELIALDGLLALVLGLWYAFVPMTRAPSGSPVIGSTALTLCLVVLLMALPVAVRRLWPVPVFLVVAAASVLALASGVLYEPFLAAALTGYTAALAGRPLTRIRWRMLGVFTLVLLLLSVSAGPTPTGAEAFGVLLPGLALVGAAWTAGVAVRERRVYQARSNAEQTARAVADERLRIAREVHDIVTHNLGIITVRAAVARHVADTQPGAATDALELIERVGRSALTDMRQVLYVLRTDPADGTDPNGDALTHGAGPDGDALTHGADPDGSAPTQGVDPSGGDGRGAVPADTGVEAELAPTVGDLNLLVTRAAAAGLDLRADITGTDRLPEGTAVSAYRILQEALTNVIKHAGLTRCQVTVRCAEADVVIEVLDEGPEHRRGGGRTPVAGSGHGLLGMRERVAMHGGELTAGPRQQGGFHLRARLPYPMPDRLQRGDRRPAGTSS
ncbi:sensor histidine kinase [Micromonospora sp. NBC_01796]|uniref:sensor histidine kinase n=1 Tax=Micromonospora sp. NBC_01796 TaxID=2975987 RepID=UPI002DDB29C6|nr:histidine kinase [Micromonospora sp. NBC_01796]WSA85273.1 histidine kinase [Micromonospora sp. NBC_01796]